jgi:hypothetical protein
MNCKNTIKKLRTINQISGINHADIEKSKGRMRFFMGLIGEVLKDKDFVHLQSQKYSCVENLLLLEGRFFEFDQKKITSLNPFKTTLDLALESEKNAYCEGFVLPWQGGIPVPHAWVFDSSHNMIISSQEGLHFGVAFEPNFAFHHFQKTGVIGVFNPDKKGEISILNSGFPKNSLFKG